MEKFVTKYMYQNKWTKLSEDLFYKDKEEKDAPRVKEIENGILLPQRDGELPWGIGGCLDSAGNFIDDLAIKKAFGGKYSYDIDSAERLDETVIYIPIIPKHWGHFLIDAICRLWIFLDENYKDKNYKIYYNSWNFENNKLTGNYRKFFEHFGIYKNMYPVDKVIQARKVLIPSATMSFSESYNKEYKNIFKYLTEKILDSEDVSTLEKKDRIYFTRSNLPTSRMKEIGEIDIEKILKDNGFCILSPEKLSLEEQVFYFHNADIVASMSGTIMHNIGFAGENTKLWIMNRTCMPNEPQLSMNRLFDNEVIMVDTYVEETLKHPRDYGTGPFWLEPNINFKHLCEDYGLKYVFQNENRNSYRMKYYVSLLYFSLKYNKFTIWLYYKLKKL
jgi:hypothetical protein